MRGLVAQLVSSVVAYAGVGCVGLVGALGVAQVAGAGTFVATETRKLGTESPSVQRAQVRIDADRMRVETDGSANAVIYRGDRDLVWLLNHQEKTFLQVDRGTTAAIARNLDAANEAIRERTQGLPPEQRQALERMLDGTLGAPPSAKPAVTTRVTDRRDLVEGVPCTEVEVMQGAERVAEACVARFQDAGVSAATFAVVRDLAAFLCESVSSMAPKALQQDGMEALDSFQQIDGVPMRVRAYEKGEAATETVVKRIEEQGFAAADFEVPEGYRGGFSLGGGGAAADPPAAPPANAP